MTTSLNIIFVNVLSFRKDSEPIKVLLFSKLNENHFKFPTLEHKKDQPDWCYDWAYNLGLCKERLFLLKQDQTSGDYVSKTRPGFDKVKSKVWFKTDRLSIWNSGLLHVLPFAVHLHFLWTSRGDHSD